MPQGMGFYSQRIGPLPRAKAWKFPGWKSANNFAEDNEIKDYEFYKAENIELVGKASIRLPRRGEKVFTTIPETKFNGWGIYKNLETGVNYLIVMAGGRLFRVEGNGNVVEIDPTKTWDANAKMRGVTLRGWFYFGNGVDFMGKTDGNTVIVWQYVSPVTGLTVTPTGGVSEKLYSYSVTAVTDVGETEACPPVEVWNAWNLDATHYNTITWDRKTDSSVIGYNIYRAEQDGTRMLLTFVDQPSSGSTVSFKDDGALVPSLIYEEPVFNTTGGVKGNIFAKYRETLFVAGNPDAPDLVFYGGTGSNWESFNPAVNGGWIRVGRGEGERVTGLYEFEDFLFILKENSVWKFFFASDGGPAVNPVIPQYGTRFTDTIGRLEKNIVFLGTDVRFRDLGYEPNQLNVIRTTDFSNRIQPRLDEMDVSNPDKIFGIVYEQKYIVCDGENAYVYDRRYAGFLDKWTGYNFSGFIAWEPDNVKKKLFAFENGTGRILQLLVDNKYTNADGGPIYAWVRLKRVDGGEDTLLKSFYFTKFKFRNGRGTITLRTYVDGDQLLDTTSIQFSQGVGIGSAMYGALMFGEAVESSASTDVLTILYKDLQNIEAYSIHHQIEVGGDQDNYCVLQSANGVFEIEDIDYLRDEKIV